MSSSLPALDALLCSSLFHSLLNASVLSSCYHCCLLLTAVPSSAHPQCFLFSISTLAYLSTSLFLQFAVGISEFSSYTFYFLCMHIDLITLSSWHSLCLYCLAAILPPPSKHFKIQDSSFAAFLPTSDSTSIFRHWCLVYFLHNTVKSNFHTFRTGA